MARVAFSLPDETVREIRRTADRLGIAQSHVVREAVADYAARTDRLGERERLRMLEVLDGLNREPVIRSQESVDAEIREIRASRRESSPLRPER